MKHGIDCNCDICKEVLEIIRNNSCASVDEVKLMLSKDGELLKNLESKICSKCGQVIHE